jgi:PIN domain nuclease of toxin-antitoxin system
MLNLDTHILVHALDDTLTPAERRLLNANPWGISAIVLWEMAKLAHLGRIVIDMKSAAFSRIFARVHVWPLDIKVCAQSTALDFGSDPVDEIIAATSIVHNAPLLTRDPKIRRSKLVPLAR